MDNLNSPATGFTAIHDGENTSNFEGFSKLEKASLMIAAGMSNGIYSDGLSASQAKHIASSSIALAKAVLEEANK